MIRCSALARVLVFVGVAGACVAANAQQVTDVPEGVRAVEAEQEEISSDVFRTYWFGRQYGMIEPEW